MTNPYLPNESPHGTPQGTGDFDDTWVSPAVWLLGATREAGVSTLERFWAFTADSEGSWPPGDDRERVSPYVVIVARESFKSLSAAQNLALAHDRGEVGAGAELLGLITVAAAPNLEKPIRQHRDVVSAAFDTVWHIAWHRHLLSASLSRLPRWHSLDPAALTPSSGFPADVHHAAIDLTNTVHARIPTLLTPGVST
jgi:hypothetical protein